VADASSFLDSIYLCVFKFFPYIEFISTPVVQTVPGKTVLGKGFLFFSGLIGINIHMGNPTHLPYFPM